VRIQRRIKEDRIFVFIVNDVATAGQAFTLRFHEKHEWHIELWDALAGERRLLRGRSAGREGRDLECDIQLEPAGSALLVLTPQSASVPHPYFTVTRARARWLARPWAIECRAENALRMDQVAYSLDDGQTFSEPETCAQVRLKLAARLALGAPVRLRYELESELDTVPGAAVVIENLTGGSLAINGQTVHTDKAGWHWDTGFGKKEIDGLLRRGRNTVDFTFPWQAQSEIEPIYIVGPFGGFFRDPAQIVIGPRPIQLASGSWVRQGFPFYAGAIVYKTDFGLPGRLVSGLRAAVRLIKPAGFLFKVRLNGQSAGILAARPWVCEITEWIRGGRNDLEIEVVGSSANLTAEIGPSGAGLLDTGLIGGVELLTY